MNANLVECIFGGMRKSHKVAVFFTIAGNTAIRINEFLWSDVLKSLQMKLNKSFVYKYCAVKVCECEDQSGRKFNPRTLFWSCSK